MAFKVGEIVQLKSGGPKMTVTETHPMISTGKFIRLAGLQERS
jgi:uncharacterized protein YodC (DUF2158 family)